MATCTCGKGYKRLTNLAASIIDRSFLIPMKQLERDRKSNMYYLQSCHSHDFVSVSMEIHVPLCFQSFLEAFDFFIRKVNNTRLPQYSENIVPRCEIGDFNAAVKGVSDPYQLKKVIFESGCANDEKLMGRLANLHVCV